MATLRLVLFVDYQNVFKGAQEAFHINPRASDGQIDLLALGQLLVAKHVPYRPKRGVQLQEVRVYRGRPTRKHDNYNAWQAQAGAWSKSGITIVSRKLRGQGSKWREKGIDVSLALDFCGMAQNGDFDIGVIFSMDHDFAPAIERVCEEKSQCTIETAVWRRPTDRWAPSILEGGYRKRYRIWNHELTDAEYWQVRDRTNYTLPKSARSK